MGRPLNKHLFGNTNTHSINATVWTTSDSAAVAGYIVRQNSDMKFLCASAAGQSLCQLVNLAPQGPGQLTIKLYPAATEGQGATASAKMKVATVQLKSAGASYVVNDVLTLVGGTRANPATVTVNSVDGTGKILTFTLNAVANQGYTALPGATISTTDSPANGTGATFTAAYAVESVVVVAGGTGYSGAGVAFTKSGSTTSATASATVAAGAVTSVTITAAGAGYTAIPTVKITEAGNPVEYVKRLTASKAVTFSGKVYAWQPLGVPVSTTSLVGGKAFATLDTQ